MKERKLTIFTPIYNRAYCLNNCYQSMRRQKNKRFVWIIVDDGSTDNLESLVSEWIVEESEFQIEYYRKENGGMYTAYNLAFEHIITDYWMCIDSDDWLADDAVDRIYDAIDYVEKKKLSICGIVGLDALQDGTICGGKLPDVDIVGLLELKLKYHHKDGSTKDSVLLNGPVGEIIAMRERIFYIDMEDHNVLKSVTYDGRKRKTWTKDPVKQFAVIGEYVICCTEDEKLVRCDMSTGKRKELADHIQYFFAGAKLYAQKGSKIVSVSYDGKEIRVFKKDVVMMDKKEDKVYYRRMDRKKEQMYVCDVDGGMEKMVGSRD